MKPNHSEYSVFTSCPLNDWLENGNGVKNTNVPKVKEDLKKGGEKINSKGKGTKLDGKRAILAAEKAMLKACDFKVGDFSGGETWQP